MGKGDLDPKHPVAGVGHPNFQQMMSADDEKKVDEKGMPVVLGLPWSAAATGLYITLCVSRGKVKPDRTVHGLSMELPSDLARDPLKQKYLMEWLAATAEEAIIAAKL